MSPRCHRLLFANLLLSMLVAFGVPAHTTANDDATVTVVTSFPPSFFEPFRKKFESLYPQWRLRVVNRNTTSAINYIQGGRDGNLDLFWASAPDAFEVLKASGHLASTQPRNFGIPQSIGNFPINDPEGHFLGFALSGYGLIWNEAYLENHGLPAPAHLEDLANPAYGGHLVLTPPSRSGTTHLMIEAVLQSRGWDEGWALLLEIGGNLATLTARSYSVAEGVAKQRFGVGITIDFLGLAYISRDSNIRFTYPDKSPFLPASIAILNNARNRPAAESFIDFLLSGEGQRLLMREDILRLPVRPDSYEQAPEQYPNPYLLATETDGEVFDSGLSSRRYDLVNLLFDQLITYRLQALSSTWRAIHLGENSLRDDWNDEAAALLRQARKIATTMPMSAFDADDPSLADELSYSARGMPTSAIQTLLEERLQQFSDEHLEEASLLANQALEILNTSQLTANSASGSEPSP